MTIKESGLDVWVGKTGGSGIGVVYSWAVFETESGKTISSGHSGTRSKSEKLGRAERRKIIQRREEREKKAS